jgi:HD-GYP domain-containing protein (c-di-GMP phosphodiesterase class II)
VAEAYISLTSKRPYRDPWEGRAAYNEIGKYVRSGKFDPSVMDKLGEIVNEID